MEEKHPNDNHYNKLPLTRRGRRVRAAAIAGAVIGIFSIVAHSDQGPDMGKVPEVPKVVESGQTVQELIKEVNGPLSAPDLFAAEKEIEQKNGENYNIFPGERVMVPDFNGVHQAHTNASNNKVHQIHPNAANNK